MPAERSLARTQPAPVEADQPSDAEVDADLPSPPPISNSAIHKAPTQFCPSGSTPPSTRPGRATSTLPFMRASSRRSSITPFLADDPSGQASSIQTAWVEPARPAPSNRGRLDWGLAGATGLFVRSQVLSQARRAVRMALFVLDLASLSFRTAPQPSARRRTFPQDSSPRRPTFSNPLTFRRNGFTHLLGPTYRPACGSESPSLYPGIRFEPSPSTRLFKPTEGRRSRPDRGDLPESTR